MYLLFMLTGRQADDQAAVNLHYYKPTTIFYRLLKTVT